MPGYVALNEIPFRAHDLLRRAVLAETEPGDRIFEGGVSSGYFARLLVQEGRTVDGAEIDPIAAEEAREVCSEVVVGDLQALHPSALKHEYDCLLFGDTLEHLPDPAALLRRLKPMLKPDGVLIVSVPNIANWAMRLSLLAGLFEYKDRGIMDRTHLRFFTKRTLRELIENSGFSVEQIRGVIPIPGIKWEPLCKVAHLIGNLWPSLFAYQFVVSARHA